MGIRVVRVRVVQRFVRVPVEVRLHPVPGCVVSMPVVSIMRVQVLVLNLQLAIFGSLDRLDVSLTVAGLLIGACTMPGAFVARRLLEMIPAHVHVGVMEVVVGVGGVGFLWRAWH